MTEMQNQPIKVLPSRRKTGTSSSLYGGRQARQGLTLLEITISVVILIVALIPIYSHMSSQASTNVETEKIQMADKILQSIKEEILSMSWHNLVEKSKAMEKDAIGAFVLTDALYPATLVNVLEVQQKFKDFRVSGTWIFLNRGQPEETVAEFDLKVSWAIQGNQVVERPRSFLVVAPR